MRCEVLIAYPEAATLEFDLIQMWLTKTCWEQQHYVTRLLTSERCVPGLQRGVYMDSSWAKLGELHIQGMWNPSLCSRPEAGLWVLIRGIHISPFFSREIQENHCPGSRMLNCHQHVLLWWYKSYFNPFLWSDQPHSWFMYNIEFPWTKLLCRFNLHCDAHNIRFIGQVVPR